MHGSLGVHAVNVCMGPLGVHAVNVGAWVPWDSRCERVHGFFGGSRCERVHGSFGGSLCEREFMGPLVFTL